MKKVFQSLLFIIAGAIAFVSLFYWVKLPSIKFGESEFLLSYLGIFLGFAFSIVTFLLGLTEKARDHVSKSERYSEIEKEETRSRISGLGEELVETMIFLFTSFIVVAGIMVLEAIDIPRIAIAVNVWYSKSHLLTSVKLSIFCWSVYSLYDLLIATFQTNARVEKILTR